MTKGLFFEYQFIQQVAMYPMVYYLLKISRTPFLFSILKKTNLFSSAVQFLSDHTLELYIIQETILGPVRELIDSFPLNMITFILLALIFAVFVNQLAGMIRARID